MGRPPHKHLTVWASTSGTLMALFLSKMQHEERVTIKTWISKHRGKLSQTRNSHRYMLKLPRLPARFLTETGLHEVKTTARVVTSYDQ